MHHRERRGSGQALVSCHISEDWDPSRAPGVMHGSWLRKHVRERRPAGWTVVITIGEVAYVCRRSYRAELLRTSALRAHPRLARLGPDLLADSPDIAEVVRTVRLGGHAEREIGDVLLDQRLAAGIGNVYKSEVLFEVCGVHPRAKVRELSDENSPASSRRRPGSCV